MTNATTDSQLVSSYLSGDRSALAAIYDRYAPGLYDTARAMLSSTHDASDMVQDVFCLAAERLGQLRDPDRLKPWLYAVLRNEVYKRTKRRRRAVPTDFQAEGSPDVPATNDPRAEGEGLAYDELASLVRAASAGLDERDRLVLELSVRQGLSGADLADALGVSPDQSYSLVHRMRDRVEKSLGALTVAKAGRRDCPQLDAVLADWDGEFTVLIRKRVNRHIEGCDTCDSNRRKLAPLALFGAAPVFTMPTGLRDRVLDATSRITPTRVTTDSGGRAWNRQGFPAARRGISMWLAGGVTAIVVAGGTIALATRDDSSSVVDGPAVTMVPATEPSDAEPTTNPPLPDDTNDTNDSISIDTTTAPVAVEPTAVPAVDVPMTTAPVVIVAPTTTEPTTAPTTRAPSTIAPTTTAARSSAIRALVVSTTTLDFGSSATSLSLTISNPNSVTISLDVTTSASVFGSTNLPATLAAGKSVTATISFDRTTAESYSQRSSFPEGRFTESLVIESSTPSSNVSNSIALTGAVTRAPVVGKLAVAFSATGCTTVRVQATVSDESSLKGITATIVVAGTTRSASMTLDSGNTYVGTITGLPSGTGSAAITVSASDATGRQGSATSTTTRPTTC